MTATLIPPKPASSGSKRTPDKSPAPAAPPKQPVFVRASMAGEKSSTDDDTQNAGVGSPRENRTDRSARLAAMLGVTIDDTSISSSSVPERPPALTSQQSDEQIVEEMSKEGVVLPIPPKVEHELSIDERIIETTPEITLPSHVESRESDVDTDSVGILPAHPLPDVEITESEFARPKTTKHGKTLGTSVISNDVVFVPKKAREHHLKKASRDEMTRAGLLLRPPNRTSSDDSDPEVAAFKRFAKSGRFKNVVPLTRRRPRRPERQLSSISEKSAEIAAEAALQQHQPQDYSISAPNTTRSFTEWQRYMPKQNLKITSGSDTQTDVDLPPAAQKRTSPSSSKTLEQQRRKKAQAEQLAKSKSEPSARRRYRLSSVPSTSSAPPVESIEEVEKERTFISSPDIPDVTFRRSLDRLDLIAGSPDYVVERGAFTSRSQVESGSKLRKSSRYSEHSTGALKRTEEKAKEFTQTSEEGETANSGERERPPSKDTETPRSSKSSHHALISRKIATRRTSRSQVSSIHESNITRSSGDLTEPRSSSSMSHRGKASRSAEIRSRRPPWNSSINVPDDKYKIYREPFLPEIKSTSKYYERSRSVLNSPTGLRHKSLSKFSLTSLPTRCNSNIEFSPYFTPGADSDKKPKEDLWWGPPTRPFR